MAKRKTLKRSPRKGPGLWFKVTDAFLEDGGYEPLCHFDGTPVFVAGKINELVIVSVPKASSPDSMRMLQRALKAHIQSPVLIVSDDVKFMRATMATDEERIRLDDKAKREADTNSEADADDSKAPVDGTGPVSDGTGSGGGGSDEGAPDDPRSDAPLDEEPQGR